VDSSSSLKTIGQTFNLVYKIILTVAAGIMLMAFVVACLHFRNVHAGIRDAERLVGRGLYEEADARAKALQDWAKCFPGRFRESGVIRIRSLVRTHRSTEAADVAERMRVEGDAVIQAGGIRGLLAAPLPWLQKSSVSMAAGILSAFVPSAQPGEWAGYTVLLDEMVAIKDEKGLEQVANDLLLRFPRSSIAVAANASRAEVQGGPSAFSTLRPERTYSASSSTSSPSQPVTYQVSDSDDPDKPEVPPSWGIVTNSHCVALNPDTGQPVRELKPGDILVIEGPCTVRNTAALRGTLILTKRNVPDLAFRREDLEIRAGDFSAVPTEEVALRSRLAEINMEETDLQLKVAREEASLSPGEIAYRQAREKMDAFTRDVAVLTAKLDKSTGSERMATLDKLRQMKYQEQTLLRDMQKKKDAAGLNSRAGESALSARLNTLRQEKTAILKRLSAGPA
jgi:hypothetical protein